MNRYPAETLPVRSRRHLTDYVLVVAIAYAPIIYAISEQRGWSKPTLAALFIGGALGLTGALLFSARARPMHRSELFAGLFLGLFLAMSALSTLYADIYQVRYDDDDMWRQFIVAMLPAVLFWGGRAWGARRFDAAIVDRAVILSLIFCGGSIVLELAGITNYDYDGGGRTRWFGYLGDAVAWVISFQAVYFLIRGRLVLFGVSLGLLLITVSMGAFAILFGATFLYFFVSRIVDFRSIVLRAAVVLVGVGFMFFAQGLVGRLVDRFTGFDLLENDRIRTIQFTLEVFRENPVIGAGYNAHTYFFQPLARSINYLTPQLGTPVSTWTQILADSGVIGFIPFLIWVLYCCWAGFRALRIGGNDADSRAFMGLSAWLIVFLPFNQSAAWLLPISILSPLVFLVAGVVVGRASQLTSKPASRRPQLVGLTGSLAHR